MDRTKNVENNPRFWNAKTSVMHRRVKPSWGYWPSILEGINMFKLVGSVSTCHNCSLYKLQLRHFETETETGTLITSFVFILSRNNLKIVSYNMYVKYVYKDAIAKQFSKLSIP